MSVFFSKGNSSAKNNPTYQDSIKKTSLTASIAPEDGSISPKIDSYAALEVKKIYQGSRSALQYQSVETKPVKKAGVVDPADLKTTIAFAEDLTAKKDLFSQNTDKHWAIASITKLMTALVALENNNLGQVVTISQSAIDTDININGNTENFSVGEKYTIEDLVKIMLTVSSNKAAAAIAEFYGQKNFIAEMNSYAKKIGMSETTYYDCTGLSVSNQSTTKDLTKLTEFILANKPIIFDYTKPANLSVTEINSHSIKTLKNIDYFSGQPEFIGGKTGTIDASKENLLALFNYQNHNILIIILGSDDRFSDTQNILNWIKGSFEF
ncbi:MAG: serine hydrolase [Patescibacteria group bacterium]|nr:serine hydrolase [Patescibacteria group bacterium]